MGVRTSHVDDTKLAADTEAAKQQVAADADAARESYLALRAKVEAVHVPKKIKLNVGGTTFVTSRGTLTMLEPNSMLAAMFSGESGFRATPDPDDGAYFIDRDGSHFGHVLNYLRGALNNVKGELTVCPVIRSIHITRCTDERTRLSFAARVVFLRGRTPHPRGSRRHHVRMHGVPALTFALIEQG